MYLFSITLNGNLEENLPELFSIPEFKAILKKNKGQDLFKAIAFYTDYDTPFRFRREGRDRADAVYRYILKRKYDAKTWETKEVENAIACYRFLQRNPFDEHVRMISEKLEILTERLNELEESKSLDKWDQTLGLIKQATLLRKEYKTIEAEMGSNERPKLKGDRVMSWLEQRQYEQEMIEKAL